MDLPHVAIEARYQAILACSLDAVYILECVRDDHGGIVDFRFADLNVRGAQLVQSSRSEMLGRLFSTIQPANIVEEYIAKYRHVHESGEPLVVDVRTPSDAVNANWLKIHAVPLSDGVVLTVRDDSEAKRLEAVLRLRDRGIAAANNGIIITDFALPDNPVIFVNGAFERITGYQADEVIGRNCRLLQGPGTDPQVNAKIRRAIAARESCTAVLLNYRKDGTPFWNELSIAPITDDQERVTHFVGIQTDVTARIEAAERLRESEERLRLQLKGIPIPTYSWQRVGDDFVLRDYNDAAIEITQGKIHTVVGRTAADLYRDRPEILRDIEGAYAEQRTIHREMDYLFMTTGRRRMLAAHYVFVPPDTLMIHTEDITERKEAERQAEYLGRVEKLRALGQLASGVAHDLNQSLAIITSYSELADRALRNQAPNAAAIRDMVSTISQAASDGGESVRRLLTFYRGSVSGDRQPVDLGQIVAEVAKLTAPRWRDATQAEGRPIRLSADASGDLRIDGWPASLREALTNLIFNAVDALPNGGTICLVARREVDHVLVDVVDDGVGMSAEVADRIFEPFFTTKEERGHGLGLSQVFGIVEQHGGRIRVESALGQGTRLTLEFPASVIQTAQIEDDADDTPSVIRRILAVDDEPALLRVVSLILAQDGHEVTTAASVAEALDHLGRATFDVVISDLGLGAGDNGWDLAREVRNRYPRLCFILATGWGATIDPDEARERGVDRVLAKPYRAADLARVLAESCSRRRTLTAVGART